MWKLSLPSPGFRFRINAKLFLPFARTGFGCVQSILVSHIFMRETNTLCTIRTNLDGTTKLHLTLVFFLSIFLLSLNTRPCPRPCPCPPPCPHPRPCPRPWPSPRPCPRPCPCSSLGLALALALALSLTLTCRDRLRSVSETCKAFIACKALR
jgi:hypothetical protein